MATSSGYAPQQGAFDPSQTTTILAKDVTSNPINAGMLFNSQMDDSLRQQMYMRALQGAQRTSLQANQQSVMGDILKQSIASGAGYGEKGLLNALGDLMKAAGVDPNFSGAALGANGVNLNNVNSSAFKNYAGGVKDLADAGKIVQMPDGRLATSVDAVPARDYVNPGDRAALIGASKAGGDSGPKIEVQGSLNNNPVKLSGRSGSTHPVLRQAEADMLAKLQKQNAGPQTARPKTKQEADATIARISGDGYTATGSKRDDDGSVVHNFSKRSGETVQVIIAPGVR
jgi:hypothetical protein